MPLITGAALAARLSIPAKLFSGLVLLGMVAPAVGHEALPDLRELVKRSAPAVVNVNAIQRRALQSEPDDRIPDSLQRFFGGPQRGPSVGSGFIISPDGYILTNNHVVQDASEIVIRMIDRREFVAALVGVDERSDLALLKVDAKNLPTVTIGDSENLEVGEWVYAIGSPFGFDYSVTQGIVSAKKRNLPDEWAGSYVPFIQSDVAINPGNSGGPLFNLQGQVVAINSMIFSRSGGFMGVSFHIPIDVAMEVADQLRAGQPVSRGWIGVQIQEVNRGLAESFGLERSAGALVSRVLPGTPAAASELRSGDIILEYDSKPIQFSSDLPFLVGRTRPGTSVALTVARDGAQRTVTVTIGELASQDAVDPLASGGSGGSADPAPQAAALGMRIGPVPADQGEHQQLVGGVLVEALTPGGPAQQAGLRRGDIISLMNNQQVATPEQFAQVARTLPSGRSVPILVMRGGTALFLPLRLPG